MADRSAYDMFFNRDGSYKTTEQYLAETEPHHYRLVTLILHTLVYRDNELIAILPPGSPMWAEIAGEMFG